MKVVKQNTQIEQVLQEIEDILTRNNLELEYSYNGFEITQGGTRFSIRDIEDGQITTVLPRQLDSERLVLMED